MNWVIAGDYKNTFVSVPAFGGITIGPGLKPKKINKKTVESYEVLNETLQTSSASAIGRATLGSLLLGPAGASAALGARKRGMHWVAIQFKDGKRSLLEVNDKVFRAITIALF